MLYALSVVFQWQSSVCYPLYLNFKLQSSVCYPLYCELLGEKFCMLSTLFKLLGEKFCMLHTLSVYLQCQSSQKDHLMRHWCHCPTIQYMYYFSWLSHKPTRVSCIRKLYNIIKKRQFTGVVRCNSTTCFYCTINKPDGYLIWWSNAWTKYL